jgi:RNA polymerase sigma-70 factor (family 1)
LEMSMFSFNRTCMESESWEALEDEPFLISELRKDKTRAFEKIFSQFYGSVTFFASQLIGNEEAAKDLVSEVFVQFWKRRKEFDSLRGIKTFLYISARNACFNHMRRKKVSNTHRKVYYHEFLLDEMFHDNIMERLFESEILREMHRVIEALPGQARRVMRLTLEGLTTQEIALKLHLKAQTVRNTRNRAIDAMRKRFKKVGQA